MDYRLNLGILDGIFAVPNCVVDEHIKLAGCAQLKALLYLLRHSGESIDSAAMGKALGLSCPDVKDALNYWAEVGILSEGDTPKANVAASVKDMPKQSADIPKAAPNIDTPVVTNGNVKKVSTAYRPSQKDAMKRLSESADIKFMVDKSRVLLGRELTGSDVTALVAFHDWVGLSADVVLMAIEYCVSQGRSDMRSIERLCVQWADSGINTHELADSYIMTKTENHKNEAQVKTAFGIGGRGLSSKEQAAIATWFNDYKFDIDMIKLAYDKTIDNTGKLSFSYLCKILESWYSKGIKTVQQACAEEKPGKTSAAGGKKNSAPSFDISSFENESIHSTPKL